MSARFDHERVLLPFAHGISHPGRLRIARERPDGYITVVLPEFLPARWWHHLLHNQTALLIKAALLFKRNTVVTSVPFHLRR